MPHNFDDHSDEQLLLQFREENDVRAFEELVHRYEKELYNYLFHYLGDANLAEDVFQGTFVRVHQKADQFDAEKPVRPWLYSIATHLAVDALRKAKRERTVSLQTPSQPGNVEAGELIDWLESSALGPAAQLEEQERRDWLKQAVNDLPDHLRQVAILVVFQGLKYREVAEILDIPVGTVKSRIHTALARLKSLWAKRGT